MTAQPAPPAEDDDQVPEASLVRLQFSDPLSWRAGKPIPTQELLRRLDALSKELTDLGQETTDKDSLVRVAKELVGHNLLGHKDKGVKAYVACGLVDILRLCAPHAPFTHTQLKDAFNLFVTVVLPALQDPSNTYNNQHKHVLASLAEVHSVVLLNDVENNEELLLHLFWCFFDGVSAPKSVSGERIGKDVEQHMTDILVALIDEGTALPPKVVDVIMAQFLRAAAPGAGRDKADAAAPAVDGSQSTLLLKEEPEAYQMARVICNSCADKMAHFVAQYFSDVIMDFSSVGAASNGHNAAGEGDDEDHAGPTDSDLKELRKAHLLLRELWRAAPLVLSSVIQQLDAELQADNIHLRQLATETVGDMISGIGAAGPPPLPAIDPAAYPPPTLADESSGGLAGTTTSILRTPSSPLSFAQTHRVAYTNFVGRGNDKSAVIRASWTTAVGYVLSTSAGGTGLGRDEEALLLKSLGDRLCDPDERVRLAAVKAIETFSFRDVVAKLASNGGASKQGSVLSNLADRCRDKRSHVRIEAMVLLGKLWAAATGELAAGDETVTAALAAVPSRIFSVFYASDPELNVLLDRVLYEYLVPLSYPPPKKGSSKAANGNPPPQKVTGASAFDQDAIRTGRILLLIRSLDPVAKKALFALQALQPQFSSLVATFLKQCELYNGGVVDGGNEKEIREKLENAISYPAQFFPDAVKVRTDLYKFAKANDRRSYQLVKFIIGPENDFKTIHRALKELIKRSQGPNVGVLDTLVPLLYRSGCIMFNRSHLATILAYSRSGQDGMAATAHEVLNELSMRNPNLFKAHLGELCKDLEVQAPTATKPNDPTVVEILKACSSYSLRCPQEVPDQRRFIQTMMNYAVRGEPPKAAKYAVNVLMAKKDEKSLLSATELQQKVTHGFAYGSPYFQNKLVAMSQLALLAPEVTADVDEAILKVVREILPNVRTDAAEDDPTWAEEPDEECSIKVLCIKFLVNKVRGTVNAEDAKVAAKELLRILIKFVSKHGEMCRTKETPRHHKSMLLLVAAQAILKICTIKHYDELLTPSDFNTLALVAQDPNHQVRRGFIEKLQKYLVRNKLRPKFYSIIFLAAFEPVVEFKQSVETWIRSRMRYFKDTKQIVMEGMMPRLLSLLAHHPDFSADPDELASHARYVLFYVGNVATESNLGLIYKYAERVKQTLDGIDQAKSENLYILSDLAVAVIKKWQEKKHWVFQAYPGKVGLPIGLYHALPSHNVAQEIAERQYLPEGMDSKLDDLFRNVDRRKKRKSTDERSEAQQAAKRQRPKLTEPRAAKPTPPKRASKAKTPSKSLHKRSALSGLSDSARRRSARARASQSYIERDSDQDDYDMFHGVLKWDYYKNENEEGGRMSTPEKSTAESEEDEEEAAEQMDDADEKTPQLDAEEEAEEEETSPPLPPPSTRAPPPSQKVPVSPSQPRAAKPNGQRSRVAAPKPKPRPRARAVRPAATAKTKSSPLPRPKPEPKKPPPARAARGKDVKKIKDVYDMDDD